MSVKLHAHLSPCFSVRVAHRVIVGTPEYMWTLRYVVRRMFSCRGGAFHLCLPPTKRRMIKRIRFLYAAPEDSDVPPKERSRRRIRNESLGHRQVLPWLTAS